MSLADAMLPGQTGRPRAALSRRADGLLIGATLLLASFHGLLLYPSAGEDDSYISYWPAHTLAAFGEIVNYNGARLEQSSSLLHVVLLGALHRVLPLNLPTLGILFSVACGLATILAGCRLARTLGVQPAWPAGLLVALSPSFVYWSFSGMETPLAALCIVLLVQAAAGFLGGPLSARSAAAPAAASLAYLAVRPEALPVLGVFLASLALFMRAGGRRSLGADTVLRRTLPWLAFIAGAGFLALAAGRLAYFGAIFPQPVTAKAGFSLTSLGWGLNYLANNLAFPGFTALSILLVLATTRVLPKLADERQALAVRATVAICLAQAAFAILSGGDWMEGGRFFAPVLPCAILLAVLTVQRLLPAKGLQTCALAALALISTVDIARFSLRVSDAVAFAFVRPDLPRVVELARIPRDRFAWVETANLLRLRDAVLSVRLDAIVEDLTRDRATPLTIVSAQMGMIAFHLADRHFGRVRLVDLRGLVADDFTRCPATRDEPREPSGLILPYRTVFVERPEIWTECGVPRPDVIFDINRPYPDGTPNGRTELLAAAGYTTVFQEDGMIRLAPGEGLSANQFIAVRNDLLTRLSATPYSRFTWPAEPAGGSARVGGLPTASDTARSGAPARQGP